MPKAEWLIETWQIDKHLVKAMHLFVGWVFLNHFTATVVKSAGIKLLVLFLKFYLRHLIKTRSDTWLKAEHLLWRFLVDCFEGAEAKCQLNLLKTFCDVHSLLCHFVQSKKVLSKLSNNKLK